MGYVEIPSIDCMLPIYHGTDESVLQIAIGHLEWSSLPTGGEGTHTVLSGHRGLPSAKLFTDLDKVVVGDVFMLHILDKTLAYEVDQILVVEPHETETLMIEEDADLCTLFTCTPYGINTHRLLVRGHRVELEEESTVRLTADAMQIEPMIVAPIAAIPILIVFLTVLISRSNKKRRVILRMKYKRIAAVLLCFAVLISTWSMQVSAEENDGVTEELRFTITFRDGAQSIVGAEFLLYKLGELDESGNLVLLDAFAEYPVEVAIDGSTDLRNVALTLEGYILRDGQAPYDTCKTDVNGIAAFPNSRNGLTPGVYLVASADFVQNGTAYISQLFLAFLPTYSEDGTTPYYDITAIPKYESLSVDGEGIGRSVVKIWDDENADNTRPESVTVDLLCNGQIFDTVTLSSDNNWRYEWNGLDESCRWTVVERELNGYTVEVSREESVFFITNTDEPDGDEEDDGDLPLTGQLWWPVPVLLSLGLLFIAIGMIRRRSAE